MATTAALDGGAAPGERIQNGLDEASLRDARVFALIGGGWEEVVGWTVGDVGAPTPRQLILVRRF